MKPDSIFQWKERHFSPIFQHKGIAPGSPYALHREQPSSLGTNPLGWNSQRDSHPSS